jgi:hypothetical protein
VTISSVAPSCQSILSLCLFSCFKLSYSLFQIILLLRPPPPVSKWQREKFQWSRELFLEEDKSVILRRHLSCFPGYLYINSSGNMFYTMAVWVTTGWSACPIPVLCEISSQSRHVLCLVENTTYPESHEKFKDCHPPMPNTQQNCHMASDCAASNVSNVLPPPCRVECRMTESKVGDGCCEINNYAIMRSRWSLLYSSWR